MSDLTFLVSKGILSNRITVENTYLKMATIVTGQYLGSLKVEMKHEQSGKTLITAAPVDNAGDGSSFSPTDLVGTALGSCLMTVMAIAAERKNIDLRGMTVKVEKSMSSAPRRIEKLAVTIHMPPTVEVEERARLEAIAKGCPVHRSLHGETEIDLNFVWRAAENG